MIVGEMVQKRQRVLAGTRQGPTLEPRQPLSADARRRLGRVYAFLMTLEPKEAPDTVEAGRPGVPGAGCRAQLWPIPVGVGGALR